MSQDLLAELEEEEEQKEEEKREEKPMIDKMNIDTHKAVLDSADMLE